MNLCIYGGKRKVEIGLELEILEKEEMFLSKEEEIKFIAHLEGLTSANMRKEREV